MLLTDDSAGVGGEADAERPGALVVLACCWMVGIMLGDLGGSAWLWLAVAAVPVLAMLAMAWRRRAPGAPGAPGARCWALVAVVAVSAAWSVARLRQIADDDIRHYIGAESQLAQLTGTVASAPALTDSRRGAFGAHTYRPPGTIFTLQADSIVVDGDVRPVRGRLLVKIDEAEHRLAQGDRVRVTGWLGGIEGPMNPGEFDYRAALAGRGVFGRMSLAVRGNCQRLAGPAALWPGTWRRALAQAAAKSLHIGLRGDEGRVALLDALLLGQRQRDLAEMHDSFRRVGLAHLLSISGAHLAILLWVVWLTVKLWVHHPSRAGMVVLAVLGLYLLVVPARVPIIRAGIMAVLLCAGVVTGRQTRRTELLALACLIVLIWRPGDLFAAGFQLSFGVVTALILFTAPLGQCIWRDPEVAPSGDRLAYRCLRWGADYIAVNVVAFCAAVPLVAYHFQMLTPLTVVLSIMSLPVIVAVLVLGYLKILLGLMLPSAGLLLAGPLAWVTDVMWALVEQAATWRGATIEFAGQPSALWTIAALGVVVAWLSGWFVRRRLVMATAIVICALWLAALVIPPQARPVALLRPAPPAMRVHVFAVGDGSCYLVRLWGERPNERYTLMFDCGSQSFPDVGLKTIVPALRQLGVRRIDTLVISHADIDHYCGSLDVMAEVPVDRVLVPPQLLAEARASPDSALALLVRSLAEREVPVRAVTRGFSETHAGALLEMLWPPADLVTPLANDTSLVLSIRPPPGSTPGSTPAPGSAPGRLDESGGTARLLLNGDAQYAALRAMLDANVDLRADVCDLPHHGSFHDASQRWLQRVVPKLVLQSSGPAQARRDQWQPIIDAIAATRLATAECGMIQVDLNRNGTIEVQRFKPAPDG